MARCVLVAFVILLLVSVFPCRSYAAACTCTPPAVVVDTDNGQPPLSVMDGWHEVVSSDLSVAWTPVVIFGRFGSMKSTLLRAVSSLLGLQKACFVSDNQLGTTTTRISASRVSEDGVVAFDSPGTGFAAPSVDLALQRVMSLLASGGVVIATFKDRVYHSDREFVENVAESIAAYQLGRGGSKPVLVLVLRTAVPYTAEKLPSVFREITTNPKVMAAFDGATTLTIPEVDMKEASQWTNCDVFSWAHDADQLRPAMVAIAEVVKRQVNRSRTDPSAVLGRDLVAALAAAAPTISADGSIPMLSIRATFEARKASELATGSTSALRKRWLDVRDLGESDAKLEVAVSEARKTFASDLLAVGIEANVGHLSVFDTLVAEVVAEAHRYLGAVALRRLFDALLSLGADSLVDLNADPQALFGETIHPLVCAAAKWNPAEAYMPTVRDAWTNAQLAREIAHRKHVDVLRATPGSMIRIELLPSRAECRGNCYVTRSFDLRPHLHDADSVLGVEAEVHQDGGDGQPIARGSFSISGGQQFIFNARDGGRQGVETQHWYTPSTMTLTARTGRWGWGKCCHDTLVALHRVTLYVQWNELRDAPTRFRTAYVPQSFPEALLTACRVANRLPIVTVSSTEEL